MHLDSRPSIFILVAALASACADGSAHHDACRVAPLGADDPNAMPREIIAHLAEHHHNHMHLDFHVARMWDRLGAETQAWATDQGISRWKLQEGMRTTGLEFLAMHRVMLEELRAEFPEHAELFAGWDRPPTDPDDADNPVPAKDAFDPDMLDAIDRVEAGQFASDDDFALFLQTKARPTKRSPNRRSPDPSAGIHNYLHNRFADDTSEITVGDPSVNLNNRIFWRIHGWVDAKWTAYRQAKGLDDATDEIYLRATSDAKAWMDDAMTRGAMHEGKADGCTAPVPEEVHSIFAE